MDQEGLDLPIIAHPQLMFDDMVAKVSRYWHRCTVQTRSVNHDIALCCVRVLRVHLIDGANLHSDALSQVPELSDFAKALAAHGAKGAIRVHISHMLLLLAQSDHLLAGSIHCWMTQSDC